MCSINIPISSDPNTQSASYIPPPLALVAVVAVSFIRNEAVVGGGAGGLLLMISKRSISVRDIANDLYVSDKES